MIDKLVRYARTRLDPLATAHASTPAIANSLRDIALIYGSSCHRRRSRSFEGRVALVQLGESYGLDSATAHEVVLAGVESGWNREEMWQLAMQLGGKRHEEDF